MLIEMTLEKFADAVASDAPVPGGGSVSALAGALAGALAAMVADLTRKKEKFSDVHPLMEEVGRESDRLCRNLLAAVDRDADSYRQVLAAFAMPKSGEEEKKARAAAVQEAFIRAAEVPLEVAESAAQAMELAGKAAAHGNPAMKTDAGVGILMARAAALGALMNVRINLESIQKQPAAAKMAEKADALEKRIRQRERDLLAAI